MATLSSLLGTEVKLYEAGKTRQKVQGGRLVEVMPPYFAKGLVVAVGKGMLTVQQQATGFKQSFKLSSTIVERCAHSVHASNIPRR